MVDEGKHDLRANIVKNTLKRSESKCLPLSTVTYFGTSNLHIMFCQKNFLTTLEVIFTSGLASIHLVKYSTATTAYL
jgi:hypothetical protein